MKPTQFTNLTYSIRTERWPLFAPFRTTGFVRNFVDVIVVTLESNGLRGRGEATGVRYLGETPATMLRQVESCRASLQTSIDRMALRSVLPPGGARNAIDCALWDLEAKTTKRPVWRIAGNPEPKPLLSAVTCGADTPENMARTARRHVNAKAIKIKLTGENEDADRVRAIREARQDAWLSVDANQGFSLTSLERLMPLLVESRVAIIEQPLPVGQEALLEGFNSPIPIAADESIRCLPDLRALAGRFDVVNIKLDKCGGLSEGISMANFAAELGLKTWVGNTVGTSLAMAPAFVLGQVCHYAELDGPLFLETDRAHHLTYAHGYTTCPPELWGDISSSYD